MSEEWVIEGTEALLINLLGAWGEAVANGHTDTFTYTFQPGDLTPEALADVLARLL